MRRGAVPGLVGALALAACGVSPPPADAPPTEAAVDDEADLPLDDARDAGPETGDVDVQQPFVDDDGDGLDDAWETEMARLHAPFLSKDPSDDCARSGLLVRVRPHPDDGALLHVIYDHLWETDCGLNGHVGDNEVFGATIDPRLPVGQSVLALRAVTHQGTPCERTTECGRCPGLPPCHVGLKQGAVVPVVFSSKNKHANYVQQSECNVLACLDTCRFSGQTAEVPLVNAGEPGASLVRDLTRDGFIHEGFGWSADQLFGFDPWQADAQFGTAGVVADDLVDPAFLTPTCTLPPL